MSEKIFERIYNFYKKTSISDSHHKWQANPVADERDAVFSDINNYGDLEHFGRNSLSTGTNCVLYQRADPEKLQNHIEGQEKLFRENTDLKLESIFFPKICDLIGKVIDGDTIIPVTAYRLGYYMSRIEKLCGSSNKKKVILEIGGGWGGLAYLVLKNIPNVHYIIVDIPTSIPVIAYFLDKCGKNIALYGEYEELNEKIVKSHDCTVTIPSELEKLPPNLIDVVVSTATLAEIPKETIDYYLTQIDRTCPQYYYLDSTSMAHGEYVFEKSDGLQHFEIVGRRKTPINCYIPWIASPAEEREYVEERLYSKK